VAVSTRHPAGDVRAPRDPELIRLAWKGALAWVWGSCVCQQLPRLGLLSNISSIIIFANLSSSFLVSHDPLCMFCLISHCIKYATRKENCYLLRFPLLPENSVLLPLAVRHTKDHTIWNANRTKLRSLSVPCSMPWIQTMERCCKAINSKRDGVTHELQCSENMYHASTAPQTGPRLGKGKATITITPYSYLLRGRCGMSLRLCIGRLESFNLEKLCSHK
jgi:hypothetical protein